MFLYYAGLIAVCLIFCTKILGWRFKWINWNLEFWIGNWSDKPLHVMNRTPQQISRISKCEINLGEPSKLLSLNHKFQRRNCVMFMQSLANPPRGLWNGDKNRKRSLSTQNLASRCHVPMRFYLRLAIKFLACSPTLSFWLISSLKSVLNHFSEQAKNMAIYTEIQFINIRIKFFPDAFFVHNAFQNDQNIGKNVVCLREKRMACTELFWRDVQLCVFF